MRVPSPFRDQASRVELQLTPLIDCVFLLMVYFLWSSSFSSGELSLPSKLSTMAGSGGGPSDQPPPPETDLPNIVIRVLWNGASAIWTVNGAPVESLSSLSEQLAGVARVTRAAPIVIDPAEDVPLGDVVDVFDRVRLAGFQRVQFAADMPGQR